MTTVSAPYEGPFIHITKRDSEEVASSGGTLAAFLSRLVERYGASFQQVVQGAHGGKIVPGTAVLVNGITAELDSPLLNGDEVVFLVSFAGGSPLPGSGLAGERDG